MLTSPLTGTYSPSEITALASLFSIWHQLIPAQQCTAAHAILWQAASLDNSNKTYQSSGGLDCKFLELHGHGGSKGWEAWEIQQVQNKTLKNLLDVVQFSIYLFFIA